MEYGPEAGSVLIDLWEKAESIWNMKAYESCPSRFKGLVAVLASCCFWGTAYVSLKKYWAV